MTSAPDPATTAAGPVDDRERLVLLDTLRGFALCGVFIANVYLWWSGRMFSSRSSIARFRFGPAEWLTRSLTADGIAQGAGCQGQRDGLSPARMRPSATAIAYGGALPPRSE